MKKCNKLEFERRRLSSLDGVWVVVKNPPVEDRRTRFHSRSSVELEKKTS